MLVSCRRAALLLLQISIGGLAIRDISAAPQRDCEIELMETTYRVSANNTFMRSPGSLLDICRTVAQLAHIRPEKEGTPGMTAATSANLRF